MGRRRQFGSIRKLPSGRWQARRPTADGDTAAASTTFETRADAARWLATVEADQARGLWVDPDAGKITLAEYAATWLDSRSRLAPRTREIYATQLRLHILPTIRDGVPDLGEVTLAKVSPKLVRGTPRSSQPGARPSPPRRTPGYARSSRRRSTTTGSPRTLAASRAGAPSGVPNSASKSEAGKRTVALPAPLIAELERHLGRYGTPGPDARVFTTPAGLDLERSNFRYRVWVPATRAVGLDGLRFHDLRHTAGTGRSLIDSRP